MKLTIEKSDTSKNTYLTIFNVFFGGVKMDEANSSWIHVVSRRSRTNTRTHTHIFWRYVKKWCKMFPNLASRFAPESYSPVANCQVSPEQLEEPAKKRTRQHTNGVSALKDGRFSQGVMMKKKQSKVHVHHYFWWGNHSKIDHRSD